MGMLINLRLVLRGLEEVRYKSMVNFLNHLIQGALILLFHARVSIEWIQSVCYALSLVDVILVPIESVDCWTETLLHDVGLHNDFIFISSIIYRLEQSLLAIEDIYSFTCSPLELFHDESRWYDTCL